MHLKYPINLDIYIDEDLKIFTNSWILQEEDPLNLSWRSTSNYPC